MLRYSAYGESWKAFHAHFLDFAYDPCNVRLAFSSDGFNPFWTMSTNYSTLLVILIPYNISHWACMKQSFFILSMIILG